MEIILLIIAILLVAAIFGGVYVSNLIWILVIILIVALVFGAIRR